MSDVLSINHAQTVQTAHTSVHMKALSQNTFYPPEGSGVGLNRSSQSELNGLNVFVKVGLNWLSVGCPPLTRGLKG